MYKRKTVDEWQIWTDYGYGLEHETTETSRRDAREQVKCYLSNCASILKEIKIIKKRVKIEEAT